MAMSAARRQDKPPFARLDFAEPLVQTTRRPDGSVLLSSGHALGDYPRSLGDMLVHQAQAYGDRVFLAERDATGGWRKITFKQTLEEVRKLAQAILDAGCDAERSVAILSGNSIDHALLSLAAMHVGVPAAPISVAYSLMSQDHAKLLHCVRQVKLAYGQTALVKPRSYACCSDTPKGLRRIRAEKAG